MASWRRTKKAAKRVASETKKPLVTVMMREDADCVTLADWGIDCDPHYFDPRGQTGVTDETPLALGAVTVIFTQDVPGRPMPRVHTLNVPRSLLVPV
jgi:hypothetical protein